MALNSLGLGFVFTAQDLASGSMNNIARSFGGMDRAAIASNASFQRNFATMSAGFAMLTTGVLALGGAFQLASAAGVFEQNLGRVGQAAQANIETLGRLRTAALDSALDTGVMPEDALNALGSFVSLGMNAEKSMRFLGQATTFAQAGMISAEDSANTLGAALAVIGEHSQVLVHNRLGTLEIGSAIGDVNTLGDRMMRISDITALVPSDLKSAFSSVSRGAQQAEQSLNEMLIAMGLVKNTGAEASVAGQSVSSAMLFMSQRAAELEQKLGVHVTDRATGHFRPFLDIILEAGDALKDRFPDAAERAAAATDMFSRFGLQAAGAIYTQVSNGIETLSGDILYGAEAVTYLRQTMEDSGGTLNRYREAIMNTFSGQMEAMQAAVRAAGIILGDGFAKALKPMLVDVRNAIRSFARWFDSLGDTTKRNIAVFVLVAGAVLTITGAIVAFGSAAMIAAPFLSAMASAAVGLAVAMAPWLAGLALIAVAAARSGVTLEKLKLGFQGLYALLTTGRLSGELLADLNKAENSGLKRFIGHVASFAFRIVQFFRGIRIGFNTAMDMIRPSLDRLGASFDRLKNYVSMIFGGGATGLVQGSSRRYVEWGVMVGNAIGRVVEFFVNAGTVIMRFTTGFIGGFRAAWGFVSPLVGFLVSELGKLWGEITKIGEELGFFTDEAAVSGQGAEGFGQIIGGLAGTIAGGLAGALGVIIRIMRVMIVEVAAGVRKLVSFFDFFFDLGARIGGNMLMAKLSILDMIDGAIAAMGRMMEAIPPGLRPEFADEAIQEGRNAQGRQATRVIERMGITRRVAEVQNMVNTDGPSNAEARSRHRSTAASLVVANKIGEMMRAQAAERRQDLQRPIILQVDGETIATVTANAQESGRQRGFASGGGGGDEG
jgi:TP901 family phage tail tape measure protein